MDRGDARCPNNLFYVTDRCTLACMVEMSSDIHPNTCAHQDKAYGLFLGTRKFSPQPHHPPTGQHHLVPVASHGVFTVSFDGNVIKTFKILRGACEAFKILCGFDVAVF